MNCNKYFLVVMACVASVIVHAASNDTIPEQKVLSVIHFVKGVKQRGYILYTTDSTIQFIERKFWKNELFMQRKIIPAENITGIVKKTGKKFSMVDGIGLGAGAGIFIGFIIGLGNCDSPDDDCTFLERLFYKDNIRTALNLSAALGAIGAVIGIFTGGKHKTKFTINGNRSTLKKYKDNLLSY